MDRAYSLKKNKEFNRVYRRGKSAGARGLALVYCKARHSSVRVGFAVGKKVGNAVVRNKVKRRLRDGFSRVLPSVRPGFDLIFIARSEARDEPFASLLRTIDYLLKKAGLLREPETPGRGQEPDRRQKGPAEQPQKARPGRIPAVLAPPPNA